MLPYFWYILKVIICSCILFGYYWLFLRNKIFHQYNRFYLLSAMGLSLLLPLLKINFWQQSTEANGAIRVLRAVSVGDEYMNTVVVTAQKSFWNFQNLYPMLYWFVSLLFLFVLARTIYIIRTLLKKYPLQQVEEVTFVNTNDDSTPFSFLKYIFWNSSIDMNTITGRQIFKHEVAHIQEKHTYDKLFVNIALIFFWCNPFFWLYRKELNMIHEFIADKKAVEDGDTAAFAHMILQTAYPKHRFELTNNFFYSPIKRRLRMLTKIDNPRINYWARLMVLPLAVLVFAAFTFKAKKSIVGNNNTITANKLSNTADTFPSSVFINVKHSDTNYIKTSDFKTRALVILDSKEIGNVGYNYIDQNDEKYSTVKIYNQLEAEKIYGIKGKYGVIKLTQKEAIFVSANSIYFDDKTKTVKLVGPDINLRGDFSDALINVEGKIITPEELKKIDQKKISSVTLLQGDKLNDITDAKDKKSVIYISLKADDLPEVKIKSSLKNEEPFIFTPVAQTNDSIPQVMLTTETGGVFYIGKLNPVNLVTKGIDAKDLVLLIKPGFPAQISSGNGFYNVQVSKEGNFEISVVNRLEGKIIQSFSFTAKRLPDPVNGKLVNNSEESLSQDSVLYVIRSAKPTSDSKQQDLVVFGKTQIAPQFIGGQEAWRDFLRKNLKANIPVDSGSKAGKYTVIVKFIIHTDGSVSDIKCEKDPGYGTCEEVKRIIQESSKKWSPAIQNGRKVNAYHKQPVTFLVED